MAGTLPNGARLAAGARKLLAVLHPEMLAELGARTSVALLEHITKRELGGRTLPDAVNALFPSEPPERLAQIADRIALHAFQDLSLKNMLHDAPRAELGRLFHCADEQRLRDLQTRRGPVIFAYWHLGPKAMISSALDHFQLSALVITKPPPWPSVVRTLSPRIKFAVMGGDPVGRALALKSAIEELRAGGAVSIAMDGRQGGELAEAQFLGRNIRLGRGAAVLARLTGAPIVPCLLTWGDGWRMNLRFFDSLPSPSAPPEDAAAFEREMTVSAVQLFEKLTRAHPGQIQLYRIPWLLDGSSGLPEDHG